MNERWMVGGKWKAINVIIIAFVCRMTRGDHALYFFAHLGSYNFGYEVGTNRQFHHEVRGSDGVTYGCFGYFDQDDKLLMTHYVADAHGYRLIESNKPVKIYPVVATDAK
jgi:hypothetical protein